MTSDRPVRSGDDFKSFFDPKDYLTRYFSSVEEPRFLKFVAESLYRIYSKGTVKGKQLLDIGSGPCINNVIPAVKWFDEIALSDFSPVNLETLYKWLKMDPDAHNWQPYFEFYSTLEGNMDKWKETERELRWKIKRVLQCDVHLDNPLDPIQKYQADAISTCLCLDSACSDIAIYQKAMQNMISLLKPGGKFILAGVLNSRFYVVGSEKFSSLTLNKTDILNAVNLAGLEILECFDESEATFNIRDQEKLGIVVLAQKK